MKSTNVLLFGTIGMAAAAQLLIKLGATRFGSTMLDSGIFRFLIRVLTTPAIFAGLTLYGVSAFLWILVLGRVELSYAYPMVAAGYILVSLLAWVLFHEEMTVMKGVALGVIAVGVVLLGLSQAR
jgi:multidrug transporter EmrE-like cation transporter